MLKFDETVTSYRAHLSRELWAFQVFNGDDLYHPCTFEWETGKRIRNSSLEGAMNLKFALLYYH